MVKRKVEAVREVMRILKREYKDDCAVHDGQDPFEALITTVLSARAKDEVTIPVSRALLAKYPTPEKLANANRIDVERIIKRIGFYRVKSKRVIEVAQTLLDEYGGKVPDTEAGLVAIPGVGRKTAACVLVYGFNQDRIPVDVHVQVIANRLRWSDQKKPGDIQDELEVLVPNSLIKDVNRVMVLFGKQVCLTHLPKCWKCPVYKHCFYDKKRERKSFGLKYKKV
ncbi:MAG: endonuclease III [Candidatus Diapherotrites archaeon]|nr:endonuclease III [Candidatus Diapherotrites archaeon]